MARSFAELNSINGMLIVLFCDFKKFWLLKYLIMLCSQDLDVLCALAITICSISLKVLVVYFVTLVVGSHYFSDLPM